MSTMTISLTAEMRRYIDQRVASGRYGNASEYFRDLVRADQDRQRQEALETLLLDRLHDGRELDLVTSELFETARERLRTLASKVPKTK